MGSIVLYIIEWAFALLVLLAIYKAVFSGTTLYRFNRFYLLGATLLSALLPLVHITIPDSTPLVSNLPIDETEFAQELSGTFMFIEEPQVFITDDTPASERKSSLWAIMLVCTYIVYVLTLFTGWTRSIIRTRRFLRGKPRRRLSRTVWLVSHDEAYGPFSWLNYIVISNTENGFARRAGIRHEFSHIRLLHSIDLIILLACTTVNPVCWLVLQEIKIVHEYEADDEVINRYGIHEQDYQRLLLIKAVGAEAYALASSFNLNIKKRIIMMNKKKTLKRRLIWLLLLIPLLGMTSVLFARTEKAFNLYQPQDDDLITVKGKVVDTKGKPVADAMISLTDFSVASDQEITTVSTSTPPPPPAAVYRATFMCFTDKNGEFSFGLPVWTRGYLSVAKEGYKVYATSLDNVDEDFTVSLEKTSLGTETDTGNDNNHHGFFVKERNIMRITIKNNGKIHVLNGVTDKDIDPGKLKELTEQFIANPKNDSRLPAFDEYQIEGYKTVSTTIKHVIEIERESGVSLESREAIIYIVYSAYHELRDNWCRKEFGTGFEESSQEQQMYAKGMYAMKIVCPEIRYYCDLTLSIRKNAITASTVRHDMMSDRLARLPGDEEQLLGVIQALEKYLDDLTADGKSRIRSVNVALASNADNEFVQEVKEVLRKRNVISIKYSTILPTRNRMSVVISGNKPGTGALIRGVVTNEDGPIQKANVTERDTNNRIMAQAISDIEGNFALRLVNPDNKLEFNAPDHTVMQCYITGTSYEIKLRKGDGFELIHNDKEYTPLNESPQEEGVYTTVDDMPEFPGGTFAMLDFMRSNLNYPDQAKEKGIQGRAIVSFIVNEDGHLSDFRIDRSTDNEELDNEAVRMAKSMPNWKPGSQAGKPVKVRYQLPVNFRLN